MGTKPHHSPRNGGSEILKNSNSLLTRDYNISIVCNLWKKRSLIPSSFFNIEIKINLMNLAKINLIKYSLLERKWSKICSRKMLL